MLVTYVASTSYLHALGGHPAHMHVVNNDSVFGYMDAFSIMAGGLLTFVFSMGLLVSGMDLHRMGMSVSRSMTHLLFWPLSSDTPLLDKWGQVISNHNHC
jgi:hypothetical protein